MNKNKGFTLIELLVVIAIIGILASVVLASLNTARQKGKDASAQSSMSAVRASAEMYYNGDGANSYGPADEDVTTGGVCGDADVTKLLDAAETQVGNDPICTHNATATQAATSYTAYVALLNSPTGDAFCVDSNGNAGPVPIDGIIEGVQCK